MTNINLNYFDKGILVQGLKSGFFSAPNHFIELRRAIEQDEFVLGTGIYKLYIIY